MENDITAKLQQIELGLLVEIDKLFREHGIRYFLAYGTTLGAARHKGFIPWDDDVDIFIFGEDYPKVKEIFKNNDTGFLSLHDYETHKDYPYVFPKIVDNRTELKENFFNHLSYMSGVYVDLFPLFSLSDNKAKKFFSEKLRYLRYSKIRLYYENADKASGARKLLAKAIQKLCNPERIQKKLYATYTAPIKDTEKLADPLIFAESTLHCTRRFKESTELCFEGKSFPVPLEYHEHLTDYYGDYMQLPPEDKRVSNHDFAHIKLEEDEK